MESIAKVTRHPTLQTVSIFFHHSSYYWNDAIKTIVFENIVLWKTNSTKFQYVGNKYYLVLFALYLYKIVRNVEISISISLPIILHFQQSYIYFAQTPFFRHAFVNSKCIDDRNPLIRPGQSSRISWSRPVRSLTSGIRADDPSRGWLPLGSRISEFRSRDHVQLDIYTHR